MIVRNRIVSLLTCWLAACACAPAARADCTKDLLTQFNAALTNRSVADAKAAEARIAVDPNCGERIGEVKRQRAALQMIVVKQLRDKNAPASDYEAMLLEASEVLWRGASYLGDIRYSQRRFGEAQIAYERALEIIKNDGLTPTAPDKKSIEAIFDSASEAKMLAANDEGGPGAAFVPAATDGRDGSVGGMMSLDIRGFKPMAIPIPVQFETATAKFSPKGQLAADELLKALLQQNPAELTLIGHTDERGEADYNMRLSDQRVKALAAFLKQNGVTAKIATVAKGKSEPLQLSDASERTREDIWALNRRVVWKRN